ncbi:MAG: chitinase, partial [Lawsonibacter sp.]|nr:chitinase [Lawsonibacter sp.]
RALCPLEDCVSSGRHYHGYSIYCGAHHDGGFCDGSCTLAP